MDIKVSERELVPPALGVVALCLSLALSACVELGASSNTLPALKRQADQLALDVRAAEVSAGIADTEAQAAIRVASSATVAAQSAQKTAASAMSSDNIALTNIDAFNERIDRQFKKSLGTPKSAPTFPRSLGGAGLPRAPNKLPVAPVGIAATGHPLSAASGALAGITQSVGGAHFVTQNEPTEVSPGSDSPWYGYRLTDSAIRRYHEEVLSVAVSTKQNDETLKKTLADYQMNLGLGSAANISNSSAGQSEVKTNGGTLEARSWRQYQYIVAKLDCDPVLTCTTDNAPKAVTNDPLIWDVKLNSAQWDATRTTVISVRFFGGHRLNDDFISEIATMPPLAISVKVYEDINTLTSLLNQLQALFKALQGALLALAAVVALILGWFGWKRKSRGKAKGSPAPATTKRRSQS